MIVKKTFHQQWKKQYCRDAHLVKLLSQEIILASTGQAATYRYIWATSAAPQDCCCAAGWYTEYLQKPFHEDNVISSTIQNAAEIASIELIVIDAETRLRELRAQLRR